MKFALVAYALLLVAILMYVIYESKHAIKEENLDAQSFDEKKDAEHGKNNKNNLSQCAE